MSDHEIVPFVEASKRGSLIVDVDGNTFADHMSSWGASPFGPTPERVKRAMEATWDRHGMQISGWVQNTPVLELTELLSASARNAIVEIEPQPGPGDGGAAERGEGEEGGASDAKG